MTAEGISIPILAPDDLEAPPLTLGQLVWRRFRRHKLAIFGAVVLIILFLYSFGGALFIPEDYANFNDTTQHLQGVSVQHPFGTDTIGRDVLARSIYGGQISLLIGLTAVIVETGLGILVGALAGYYGGVIDSILMRITEAMLNIPEIFLLIVMAKFFGGKISGCVDLRANVQWQCGPYCFDHRRDFMDVPGSYCQGGIPVVKGE